MQVSEYLGEIRNQSGRDYKTPLFFFALWLILELSSAFVPASFSDIFYDQFYFWTEDLSTISLALACYFSLSYTSTILKAVSLTAVIVTTCIMFLNILVEFSPIPKISSVGLTLGLGVIVIGVFLIRFLFRVHDGTHGLAQRDIMYLVIDRPKNFLGVLALLYSGIGGGFSVYVNGDCYWFPRDAGKMVKTHEEGWCRGKNMIDCGPVTGDKLNDLESMIGQKWSIFNNCFTVFSRWRRRWT